MAAKDVVELLEEYRKQALPDESPLRALSERGHFSRSHLSRQLRHALGVPLREFAAALRIERSISAIVDGRDIDISQHRSGHVSKSSFHRSFQRHTGMTPGEYARRARALADFVRLTSDAHDVLRIVHHGFAGHHPQEHPLTLTVEGAGDDSVLFLALNPTHIIRGNPAFGVALRGDSTHVVDDIPPGTYYAMVVEVPRDAGWRRFFVLDDNPRQLDRVPITFPLASPGARTLTLRELEPTDPPIAANLPYLVFAAIRARIVSEESNSGHPDYHATF